jgi:DNA polymerase-4
MDVYAAVSAQVFGIFERYTPLVEPLSLDEAFLDVTGCEALFGDGAAIAERVRADVRRDTHLTVSVGVATTKYVAKVASDLRKPDGMVVVPAGGERAFLAPLPVGRLWGAGPVTQERLRQAGIATIGDVARLPRERLVALVGEAGAEHYHALANGVDPREVEPDREAKSISHETTFDEDVRDEETIRRVLLELSEAVGRRLRRHAIRGEVVRLKLRYPPFETHTRQKKLEAPTDDDLAIFRTAKALLDAARRPGRPVRLLGVGVSGLLEGPQERQGLLFGEPRASAKSRDVLRAMDAIRDRFGDDAIGHA